MKLPIWVGYIPRLATLTPNYTPLRSLHPPSHRFSCAMRWVLACGGSHGEHGHHEHVTRLSAMGADRRVCVKTEVPMHLGVFRLYVYICMYVYIYIYIFIFIYIYNYIWYNILEIQPYVFCGTWRFFSSLCSRLAIFGSISFLLMNPLRHSRHFLALYPIKIYPRIKISRNYKVPFPMKSMKWIEMVGCLRSNAMKSINSREISSEIWHGCHIPWSPSKFPAYHCLSAISTARGCWALRRRLTCEIRPGRWVDPKMMIYMMFIYIYMYIYIYRMV